MLIIDHDLCLMLTLLQLVIYMLQVLIIHKIIGMIDLILNKFMRFKHI